jgi:hypothetical protein
MELTRLALSVPGLRVLLLLPAGLWGLLLNEQGAETRIRVVAADSLDALRSMHEAMEEATMTVKKAGILTTLAALAAGNQHQPLDVASSLKGLWLGQYDLIVATAQAISLGQSPRQQVGRALQLDSDMRNLIQEGYVDMRCVARNTLVPVKLPVMMRLIEAAAASCQVSLNDIKLVLGLMHKALMSIPLIACRRCIICFLGCYKFRAFCLSVGGYVPLPLIRHIAQQLWATREDIGSWTRT